MHLNQQQAPDEHATVTLQEISEDTLSSILDLKVAEDQKQFVAPNEVSIAQAYFSQHAWFRAIYAGKTPVGFVMLYDDPDKPEYFLWRLMVDARYQKLGYARRAIKLLIEYVRTRPNATELLVSHVPGEGSPGPFYGKLGFEYTGEEEGDELVMRLPLI